MRTQKRMQRMQKIPIAKCCKSARVQIVEGA